jgi:hypothetical protein
VAAGKLSPGSPDVRMVAGCLMRFLLTLALRRSMTVGAENLCHQAIFMNHAPCAVTPLDPELIQVCNAAG